MGETTISRAYAEALFEFAMREDAVELYGQRLQEVADLVETERDFRRFLQAPGVQPAEKIRVLENVFGKYMPEHLLSFLAVVIEKRRERYLPSMAEELSKLVDEHFGRLRVVVTLASEPDASLKKRIKKRLDEVLKRDVIPHYRIDPRIIGGLIFKVGDHVGDGSLRRRLQLLRHQLLRAPATA